MEKTLAEALEVISSLPREKKRVTAGFDVVVDTLSRPIESYVKGKPVFFETMEAFASHLYAKSGLSCCIQMDTIAEKIGGNMAVLSAALLGFGMQVELMGALEGIGNNPLFEPFQRAICYPVSKPGHCTALEFRNGKMMLAGRGFVDFSWEVLTEAVGPQKLGQLVREPELLCLVNWSEMLHGNEIWGGIAGLLEAGETEKGKYVFFDLADCSAHPKEEVLACIRILQAVNRRRCGILSMNRNEASILGSVLGAPVQGPLAKWGQGLADALKLDGVVIHTSTSSAAYFAGKEPVLCPSFHTETPAILTGGGDNFNAGFLLGLLQGLDTWSCLLLANANSGYYVRYGTNTDVDGLVRFIQENQEGLIPA